MANANLVVWASDWHTTINDIQSWQHTKKEPSWALSRHIASLLPQYIIVTGDCSHDYGLNGDMASFRDDVCANFDPPPYLVRGNHDENQDVGTGTVTSFALFDSYFAAGSFPYRWTLNWTAPQIQFIAFHTTIVHTGANQGYFNVSSTDRSHVSAALAALPVGWKAILVAHPPHATTFGNYIHASEGGSELSTIVSANAAKILCYLGGHRHSTPGNGTAVQDGITHVNGAALAYTGGGGFMLLEYRPAVPDVIVYYRSVTPPFGNKSFVPLTFPL
jgi:hypothetical protein